MKIRTYLHADSEALAEVFTESVHNLAAPYYSASQLNAWAPKPPNVQRWQLEHLPTLVAEIEGHVAGFISFEPSGHIQFLFSSPMFKRQHVASQLYEHVELQLRKLGVAKLFTEASLASRSFFEFKGFHVTEEQSVEFNGQHFCRFAMSKFLEAA